MYTIFNICWILKNLFISQLNVDKQSELLSFCDDILMCRERGNILILLNLVSTTHCVGSTVYKCMCLNEEQEQNLFK